MIKFEPELPPWKLKAINEVKMTRWTKVFCKFKTNFWGKIKHFGVASPDGGYFPYWLSVHGKKSNILIGVNMGDMGERVEKMG